MCECEHSGDLAHVLHDMNSTVQQYNSILIVVTCAEQQGTNFQVCLPCSIYRCDPFDSIIMVRSYLENRPIT